MNGLEIFLESKLNNFLKKVFKTKVTRPEYLEIEQMILNRAENIDSLLEKSIAVFSKDNLSLDFNGKIWFDRVRKNLLSIIFLF